MLDLILKNNYDDYFHFFCVFFIIIKTIVDAN